MNKTTKEFLLKLAELLHDYKVEMEVTESRSDYSGFSVDGLEFTIPYVTDDGYPLEEFVELSGKYHNSTDVFDYVQKETEE